MRTYQEYLNNPIPRSGRKPGSKMANRLDRVYKELRKDGKISISYTEFHKMLDVVADKFWDRIYSGYQSCIPYICTFEVVPSRTVFTKSIDWKRTHDLWKHDEQAYYDRLLIRNRPLRYCLKIRHSTLSFNKHYWYLSRMLKIKANKPRMKAIQDKYEVR